MYDSTLGDEQLIDHMFEQAKARQSAKRKEAAEEKEEYRPPRRGYSREVEAIYDLTDNVIALRAEMGKWPRTTTEKAMVKRPWFPAEAVADKMRKRAKAHVSRAITAAQTRWRANHDRTDRP